MPLFATRPGMRSSPRWQPISSLSVKSSCIPTQIPRNGRPAAIVGAVDGPVLLVVHGMPGDFRQGLTLLYVVHWDAQGFFTRTLVKPHLTAISAWL